MLRRRIRLRNNQIINRTLILILTAFTSSCHPWLGVSVGGIKFTQAKLSPIGRQDRVTSSSGTNTGVGSGINDVGASTSDGIPKSGKMTVNGNADSGGGEILVPKSYPLSAQEPTCEELRAMWIFSKRQSRAAEITNEIPTYRDPFAYNVWDPYYSTTRSLGGLRMMPRYPERSRLPVFGRIISREPTLGYDNPRLPTRQLSELTSLTSTHGSSSQVFGSETKPPHSVVVPRRQMQYRFSGVTSTGMGRSGIPVGSASSNSVAVQGSFQKLKELIWTERARELTKQRRTEELAARASVLKEIAKGQNYQSIHKHMQKSDAPLMDKNRDPDQEMYQAADSRLSISEGQSISGIQSTAHDSGLGYNLPSSGSKFHNPTFFTGNPSTKSIRTSRLMQPGIMAGIDDSLERKIGGGKPFPLRPSHFRERNRSLFKEQSKHRDYFSRIQRVPISMNPIRQSNNSTLMKIVDLIQHELLKLFDEQEKKEGEAKGSFEWKEQSRSKRIHGQVLNSLSGYSNTIETGAKNRGLNKNWDVTLPALDVE